MMMLTSSSSLDRRQVVLCTRRQGCSVRRQQHVFPPAAPAAALPRISDFIRDECPIRGLDGAVREQPVRPGTELQDSCVLQVSEEGLLVPGQRQLLHVTEQQLERIIADGGRVTLACLELQDDVTAPRLLGPTRGSWSVGGRVCGVQRLPGSSRALVRLLVTDRVAVQALSRTSPDLVLARSALLQDRWCYFVRHAALALHLDDSSSSDSGNSSGSGSGGDSSSGSRTSRSNGLDGSGGGGSAGRDVLTAVEQVQDAASELLQLLQQLAAAVQAAVDGGPAAAGQPDGASSSVRELLVRCEAAEELVELLAWCEMSDSTLLADSGNSAGPLGADRLLPADGLLLERAWRLSFAPFALTGVADALGVDEGSRTREVLEMTDLGVRLEAAWDVAQVMRQQLAARLSLERL